MLIIKKKILVFYIQHFIFQFLYVFYGILKSSLFEFLNLYNYFIIFYYYLFI